MISKNSKLIALAVLLILPYLGFSQAPELFNYQAVVRDLSGTILANDDVDFRFTIRSGSPSGTIEYQEIHPLVTTNDFGLVNLIIGNGIYISGDFSTIDWGNNTHYIEVELDPESDGSFLLMGTPQLISVPYALHAGNTFSGDYNDLTNTPTDNDSDSLNELQQLLLSGTDLSITDGNTVDLSSLQDGTGTDDQNISGSALNGTDLTIGIENGNSETIDLSSLNTDDQTLSLSGTDLTIADGNTVDLSSLQDGTGTDDQFLSISGSTLSIEDGNDVDLSTADDQTLSIFGTFLTIDNGNTIDLSSLQDGTGTDDQFLSISGSTLYIENGNNVDLSGLDTDDQTLSLSGTDLTITDGNTIDLSSLQDGTGTDDQNISGSNLTGTNLTIGIEGGNSETIDLSSLQDGTGTDDQQLTLTGTNLSIEDGNSVDLSGLDTDDQTLSLSGTDLTITDGNTIDLSSLQDGTGTDDQNISGSNLTGTNLTIGIEGGNSETIDLSSLQDGVIDADSDPGNEIQALSISGNTLSISGSNSVTIPSSSNYWTSSGSDLYNNTGSFVGIGTPNPDYTLDVAGDIGVDQYIYHNGDSDTYIEFSSPGDNFDVWVGGANVIDATPGFGSSGNIAFPPVDIRMENIPATTLAVDDRVVVSNSSGYLKTVAQSSLVEDEVVEITNANHTTVAVNDNDLVRITEEILLSGTYYTFDQPGLHISGGKITGSGTQTVHFDANSVIEGVTFSGVNLRTTSTTQFIACTFISVTEAGFESNFEGCEFNSCTMTNVYKINSLESCTINNSVIPRVQNISDSEVNSSTIGDHLGNALLRGTNSYYNDSKVYVSSTFTGNSLNESSVVAEVGNFTSISGNSFNEALAGEDYSLLINSNGSGVTNINISGNSFFAQTSQLQSIEIDGTFTSSIGLISISGNSFVKGQNAITSNSNIRTTINNNTSTNVGTFGVTQLLPNRIVRDNDVF